MYEITAIKPIQPLTPAKVRIKALKQAKDRANDVPKAERDRQEQAKAAERVRTAQQDLTKVRLSGS